MIFSLINGLKPISWVVTYIIYTSQTHFQYHLSSQAYDLSSSENPLVNSSISKECQTMEPRHGFEICVALIVAVSLIHPLSVLGWIYKTEMVTPCRLWYLCKYVPTSVGVYSTMALFSSTLQTSAETGRRSGDRIVTDRSDNSWGKTDRWVRQRLREDTQRGQTTPGGRQTKRSDSSWGKTERSDSSWGKTDREVRQLLREDRQRGQTDPEKYGVKSTSCRETRHRTVREIQWHCKGRQCTYQMARWAMITLQICAYCGYKSTNLRASRIIS